MGALALLGVTFGASSIMRRNAKARVEASEASELL